MKQDISTVLICATSNKIQAERLVWALGYGLEDNNTFSVPLSITGLDPATHYGAHGWVTQEFKDMVDKAKKDDALPTKQLHGNNIKYIDYKTTHTAANIVRKKVHIHFEKNIRPLIHFNMFIASLVPGLKQIPWSDSK